MSSSFVAMRVLSAMFEPSERNLYFLKRFFPLLTLFFIATVGVSLFAGCAPACKVFDEKKQTDDADKLRVRLKSRPETLHWMKTVDAESFRVVRMIQSPLVGWDPERGLHAASAVAWNDNISHTRFVFELDPKKTWSDGTPVTAHDFKRALALVLDPQKGFLATPLFNEVIQTKDVEVLNTHTLIIRTRKPTPYLFQLITNLYPVHADDEEQKGNMPLRTSGTYQIEKNDAGSILLKRRFGSLAHPRFLEFVIVEEDSTSVRLFESGHLDLNEGLAYLDIDRFEKSKLKELKIFPSYRQLFLAFNQNHPILSDQLVRQVLISTVDRSRLAALRPQTWNAIDYWAPPEFLPATDFEKVINRSRLVAQAKNIFQAKRIESLEILGSGREDHKQIIEALQSQWQQHGIKVNARTMEWRAYLTQRRSPETQMFLGSWGGSFPHAFSFLNIFLDKGPVDFILKNRDGFTKLVASELSSNWVVANLMLTEEENVLLPLVREKSALLLKSRFMNLKPTPFGFIDYSEIKFVR